MYELANQIRIKELPAFYTAAGCRMMENSLIAAYSNGVDIGELAVNSFVYDYDDIVFSVEYIKMLCKLSTIFKDIYDNNIYALRVQGHLQNIPDINFHFIFNEINNKFNAYVDDMYIFEESGIYQSEIALETTTALYDIFNDTIVLALKDFVEPLVSKYIFNKVNVKYLQNIYDNIMTQLQNVFSLC